MPKFFEGVYTYEKALAIVLVIAMVVVLSACGVRVRSDDAMGLTMPAGTNELAVTDGDQAAIITDGGILNHVELSDYRYEIYGEIAQTEDIGDCWVVAIRPLSEGGEAYADYPWTTAYVAKDVLTDEIMGTEPWSLNGRAFKFEMANDAHGGGFIHLPSVVLSVEELAPAEIPFWGGR